MTYFFSYAVFFQKYLEFIVRVNNVSDIIFVFSFDSGGIS